MIFNDFLYFLGSGYLVGLSCGGMGMRGTRSQIGLFSYDSNSYVLELVARKPCDLPVGLYARADCTQQLRQSFDPKNYGNTVSARIVV